MKRGILMTMLVVMIVLIILVLGAGFIYLQFTREPSVPEHSVLSINLGGAIVDFDQPAFSNVHSVKSLWFHIKRAKIDRRIRGIHLNIGPLQTGLATVHDVGILLRDFKTSGKSVHAFIENGGIKEYYLASFADKIHMFRGGYLSLKGLAAHAVFIKNTLSKLGIRAQMFHMGDYKTAGHMLTEDAMTPQHREALETLADDLYDATLRDIAANRRMELNDVKAVFDDSPFTPGAYLEARMVDAVGFGDESRSQWGPDAHFLTYDIYKETTHPLPYQGPNKIAVIFASGEIHSGKSGDQSLFGGHVLGAESVVEQLRRARFDPRVKAVVLRINSPGGSAAASEKIRREGQLLAREKPLVVSMADMAASGGYWLAMAATKVMALPQTITGSIGVISGKLILKELYDNIGLRKEVVKTSPHADMFSDYRPFTPREIDKVTALMKHIYDDFVAVVAANRRMSPQQVEPLAGGRVWSGTAARKLKLVDRLGGLDDAVNEAVGMAKIPTGEGVGLIIMPREKSVLEIIFDLMENRAQVSPMVMARHMVERYGSFFPALMVPFRVTLD